MRDGVAHLIVVGVAVSMEIVPTSEITTTMMEALAMDVVTTAKILFITMENTIMGIRRNV